jgi:hypothetical protein
MSEFIFSCFLLTSLSLSPLSQFDSQLMELRDEISTRLEANKEGERPVETLQENRRFQSEIVSPAVPSLFLICLCCSPRFSALLSGEIGHPEPLPSERRPLTS